MLPQKRTYPRVAPCMQSAIQQTKSTNNWCVSKPPPARWQRNAGEMKCMPRNEWLARLQAHAASGRNSLLWAKYPTCVQTNATATIAPGWCCTRAMAYRNPPARAPAKSLASSRCRPTNGRYTMLAWQNAQSARQIPGHCALQQVHTLWQQCR